MSPIILNPDSPASPAPSGLSLGDAIEEMKARGFDYLSDPRIVMMLNDAKNKFEDVWEFPWLQASVSGAAPMGIWNLKYILNVKMTATARELLGLDRRVLMQDTTRLADSGPPQYWYLGEDVDDEVMLRTWPISDDSVFVTYIALSPQLQANTDFPLIPARYHSIWIDLAVIEAYHDSDNFISAQQLQADVNTRLQQVIERYETRNRQHSSLIAVRYPSEDD